MPLILKSLDAVTATGAGDVLSFDKPRSPLALQVAVTGAPSSAVVSLQASLDGVTWSDVTGIQGAGATNLGGSDFLALFLRANLVELTGGTSPTVTAFIAAGD